MDKIKTGMNDRKKIAILLATYNGASYLAEQINSIIEQTNQEWTLYIHDDGSTDGTQDIIKDFCQKYNYIVELTYPGGLGAMNNFFSMLQHIEAEYYSFCDQDDVWLKDKISLSMEAMYEEQMIHPGKPCLVFTDLYVTDQKLNILHPSFWHYTNVHPELIHNFNDCGATLFVTGCTMLFNKDAYQAIIPPVPETTMHDAWITLCIAKSNGILHPINKQLVYYRQHEDNTLGAKNAAPTPLIKKLANIRQVHKKRMRHYNMLKAIGYGSLTKHILYKIIYKSRIWRKRI